MTLDDRLKRSNDEIAALNLRQGYEYPLKKRIAELENSLSTILDHHRAMSGPRAHRLGCECGGTNDRMHSCASLQIAIVDARKLLEDS